MNSLIEELYKLTNFKKDEYKLDSIRSVAKELDLLSPSYKIIHVAGTNGKGSVCFKIANVLTNSGYKTGLFSSPHISTFRERISVDHKLIGESVAYTMIQEILDCYKAKIVQPTFFEVITLLALGYFKKQKVQYAVLETGLGGRLDATNILTPILTIITSISLDHTHILGDTLEKIAFEKAGIIKQGVPIVLGPTAKVSSIVLRAQEINAPITYINKRFSFFEEENREIARRAISLLEKREGLKLPDVEKYLSASPGCRFEVEENIVFDVAHNEKGIEELIKALKNQFPDKKLRFLLALSQDKEQEKMLLKIVENATFIHPVCVSERLAPIEEIGKGLKKLSYEKFSYKETFSKTVQDAFSLSKLNGEILVVTGSFFHMHGVKTELGLKIEKDALDLNEKGFLMPSKL